MGGGTTGSAIPEDVGGATGSAVPEDEDPHLSPVQTVPSGQFGVLSSICTQRGETQVYPGGHAWTGGGPTGSAVPEEDEAQASPRISAVAEAS